MDELTQLIDKMVHEKTFSMEGVEAVKALRDKAQDMEAELTRIKAGYEREKQQVSAWERKNGAAENRLKAWEAREQALQKRELTMTELEKAAAVARAKEETFRECVGLVFRNSTLRREMFGQQPIADNSGFATQQPKSETVTETMD